ncbi:MAG: ABC transporter permease subunit [Planctomycetota bacterium]
MSGALRVLRAELFRLRGSRAAWIGGILVAIVPMLRVWAAVLAARAQEIERIAAGRDPIGLSEGTGWAHRGDGWRAGLMLGTALLLVQAARSIAGDRETGVLRLAVTRSVSRSGAVVGRALLGPLLVLGIVAISGLAALAASKGLGGSFGDLVEDDYVIFTAGEVGGELARALVVVTLGLMSIHAFGLLVSSFDKGPVLALAGSLSALLLWDVFKSDVGELRWYVFASHAPTFADGSGMREMSSFARGMSDAGLPEAVHNMGLVFPLVEGALFVLLATLILRRRPI